MAGELIHSRGTHRRHNHPRDPRYHRIPRAFGVFAGRQRIGHQGEREIGPNGDIVGVGAHEQFAQILRSPRFVCRPYGRVRIR